MSPREHTAGDFVAPFASGLLDPAQPAPAVVVSTRGVSVGRRYDVYRNNVTASLVDALAAVFPAVLRITGDAFFRALAREHVRARPPTSPLLFDYGRDFPAFVAGCEHTRTMPWLADVARIERAWLDAYHARDRDPLAPEQMAAVPPDRLADVVFVAHPACHVVQSDFAAVTIFAANRDTGDAASIDASTAEDALITRPGQDVMVRHLPPGAAGFILDLMAGHTLGAAAANAFCRTPEFDLAGTIAGMIEAGTFTAVTIGDNDVN